MVLNKTLDRPVSIAQAVVKTMILCSSEQAKMNETTLLAHNAEECRYVRRKEYNPIVNKLHYTKIIPRVNTLSYTSSI